MAGNESLFNKIDDSARRREEEEADERKPLHAMRERQRQIDERQRESTAQTAAKIEALFTVAGSVKAMNASFNELEIQVLRFLEVEFVEKGGKPEMLDGPATYHSDVMAKFNLSPSDYRRLIARFRALQIVNPKFLNAPNGYLEINPCVVEIVRQINEEASQKKEDVPPVPNRMDQAKQWAFSKWYVVIPLIALAVVGTIVLFITNMKTVLDWFGIKK
jgi:hypothetical protein